MYLCIAFSISLNVVITAILWIPIGGQIFKRFKRKPIPALTPSKDYVSACVEKETELFRTELTTMSSDVEEKKAGIKLGPWSWKH